MSDSITKKTELLQKMKDNSVRGKDLFLLLEVIREIATKNDDIKDFLKDLSEEEASIKINVEVDNYKGCLIIENATINIVKQLMPNPTVTVKTTEETARNIMLKKIGLTQSVVSGKVKLEGNLMKASGLIILINICGDEIGIV